MRADMILSMIILLMLGKFGSLGHFSELFYSIVVKRLHEEMQHLPILTTNQVVYGIITYIRQAVS